MDFVTIDRFGRIPQAPRPFGVLTRDDWDDRGWRTTFHLAVVDEFGRHNDIGTVKIGAVGMDRATRPSVQLLEKFSALSADYFSVGQDVNYYERIKELGYQIRKTLLRSLRDIAFDEDAFNIASREQVTQVSLMRNLRTATVEEQFRRVAREAGARLVAFRVAYETPSGLGGDAVRLNFHTDPEGLPPSNVHVLTGRNGVGKSVLLNRLVRAVVDRRGDPVDIGRVVEQGRTKRSFVNVVSVSFSPFDALPFNPTDRGVSLTHVGLRAAPPRGGHYVSTPLKTDNRLKKDFAESVEACLGGEQKERWIEALSTLSYSGSGLLEGDWLATFQDITSSQLRRREVNKMFASLSSGHKALLLTMTRLVELVDERTLVVIDEPETHIHPPQIAAFVRALSNLLSDRNGLAIVATHSPVVLQEVRADCVWKLHRVGDRLVANRPTTETFGENVGVITHEIFGLEVRETGFHRELSRLVDSGLSYPEILVRFQGRLGGEARIIARSLIALRESGELPGGGAR
ncbi:AAA family ATPase [Streptomyces microflavus]|uniref:AAA family ATPase n=1 Tax=Streptomyces microflavus TaxID=1919 RepID=UPI0029A43256|nr:AAA family ATPase [Streptomyces microflavus]MDX2404557.1 AAA family ATPase [Streptomyces microflavus]